MKTQKIVMASVIACLVVGAATAATAAINSTQEASAETKAKIETKVEDHLTQVKQDLHHHVNTSNEYVEVRYDELNKIINRTDEFTTLKPDSSDLLARSVDREVSKLLEKGDWMPMYFVKPDATEYLIAIKKPSGENRFWQYKLENGNYVQVKTTKTDGANVELDVNVQ